MKEWINRVRGGISSTLYACMEISQQNPFIQLMSDNKKEKKFKT
jgi:hypothetical protein